MSIFLPVAGVQLSAALLLGLGGMVGLLSGLFGVGGGFLLTPLLMMIGVPPAVAAASDTNQIVAASVSGTLAHGRNGNVDFKLGLLMIVGGLLGGTVGTGLVRLLRQVGNFDVVVKIIYVLMLLIVGVFMFCESYQALRKKDASPESIAGAAPPQPGLLGRLPLKVYFAVSGVECSLLTLFGLGLVIGVLAALMGVGGGFIMLPVMIYLLRIPTMKAVGTSLFTVLFTAINVTMSQTLVNQTVDLLLALLLLIGSAAGAQIGTRLGRLLRAEQLRIVFSLIVLGVMVKMAHDLLIVPASLVGLGGGH